MQIGTTTVKIGTGLVQNLGPDILYVADTADSVSTTGVQVAAGQSVEVQDYPGAYAASAGTSDVRILVYGGGMYGAATAAS